MTKYAITPNLFSAVMASTVHDIKNSLVVVLDMIRQLNVSQLPVLHENCIQLEFETNRINHCLMQLLVIYKIDINKFGLELDEHLAWEILNEAKLQQEQLAIFKHIDLEIQCADDLLCYCDFNNISNALGTILNNALRYTRSKILISATTNGDFVQFCIEDDGEGFPEHLLNADFDDLSQTDWLKGNTGLGLYFVSVIAGLHHNQQHTGYITIDNQSSLGGARFCLFLP